MESNRRSAILLVCAAMVSVCGVASAQQQRPEDRRRFMDPGTPTTDDPRRIPVPPGARGPEGTTVLRGGRVFDGTGAPARSATLVMEGNRITAVLPPAATSWPSDARVHDVSGATVLPGLIDLHTHLDYTEPGVPIEQAVNPTDATLRAVERLRFFLESGITTVRDTGSKYDVPFRLKEWVGAMRIPGPRVFAAGQLITATGGHGAEGLSPSTQLYGAIREASGPDDWREMMAARGVDAVPTLQTYAYIFDISGGYYGSTSRRFSFSKQANLDVLERMKKAGIRMGVGTDLVMSWFRYLPTAYIRELQWFVEGGYSRVEALVAATRTGAEILGLEDKLGTLEPGKLADVLVVEGNPDEDLEALAEVDLVFRDGHLVVEDGRLHLPRHIPEKEPGEDGKGRWR